MARTMRPSDVRRQLLRERGIVQVKPEKHRQRRLLPGHRPSISGRNKTPKMLYLELKYGKMLEEQLVSGSLNTIVTVYGGEVDRSTVSRWIKRFKVRYSKDNLPVCDGCKYQHPCCQYPTCLCNLLVRLERWDLVDYKRKELQG